MGFFISILPEVDYPPLPLPSPVPLRQITLKDRERLANDTFVSIDAFTAVDIDTFPSGASPPPLQSASECGAASSSVVLPGSHIGSGTNRIGRSPGHLQESLALFEKMVRDAPENVLRYDIGYRNDAVATMAQCSTRWESFYVEETYCRNLIVNAFYQAYKIYNVAIKEIFPMLVSSCETAHVPLPQGDSRGFAQKTRTEQGTEGSRSTSFPLCTVLSPGQSLTGEGSNSLARLTGRYVDVISSDVASVVTEEWDPFSADHSAVKDFNSGKVYYKFMCKPLSSVSNTDTEYLSHFVNCTSLTGEYGRNASSFDLHNPAERSRYVVAGVKFMYVLPGVLLESITPQLIASRDYQRASQASDVTLSTPAPDTFRMSKPIIKYMFSFCVQFKVTELANREQFTSVEGVPPGKVILMERTKNNMSKKDATAAAKSVMLFYPIEGGVFVSHTNVVLNSRIPSFIAHVVNNYGSVGAGEGAKMVEQIRKFLVSRFGDARSHENFT